MTEKVVSQVKAAEIGFLRRGRGMALRNKMCSCEICKTWMLSLFFSESIDLQRSSPILVPWQKPRGQTRKRQSSDQWLLTFFTYLTLLSN